MNCGKNLAGLLVRSLAILLVATLASLAGLRIALGQSAGPTIPPGEKELILAGFGGPFQKGLEKTLIPAFEQKYGVKVTYTTGTSDQLYAKARAQGGRPQVDVVMTNSTTHYQGKQDHLFEKLDPKWFGSVLKETYPFARDPDGIGVVHGIQGVVLEYNAKVFSEKHWKPPTSWLDLWDPKYSGHVVMMGMPLGYTNLLLGEISLLQGGSARNVEPGFAKFAQLMPNVLAVTTNPAQIDNLFTQGSAWVSFNGQTRVWQLREQGVQVALSEPKEGPIIFPQLFDIVKNAPHPTLAQAFVSFALTRDMQTAMTKPMLFGPVNKLVKLDPQTAAMVPYGEGDVKRLVNIDIDPINARIGELTDRWNAIVAGKR